MPRIRTIKPHAFRSLSLSRVPIPARWLFAGLWTEADDEGRVRDHGPLLRSQLLGLDDVSLQMLEEWLAALEREGSICRYVVNDERFLHIPRFQRHQVINRPAPSELPGCPIHNPAVGSPPSLVAVNPRRCAGHQHGPAIRCGACREARVSYEESVKAKPTLSALTTMCPEHPEHPLLNCPGCAAIPPTTAPANWRDRKDHA